ILSGITIISSDSNYGIVVDNTKNVQIKDNKVVGGITNILVSNSDKITLSGNNISQAKCDGLHLQNIKNSVIEKNDISFCKKSGILTDGLYYSNITYNTIYSNDLNGITVNGISSHNLIYKNTVYNNINGIYINSTSVYDQVKSNSMTDSRRDPRSIMGGDETGNGFLLGSGFKSSGESILKVEHNYFAHNQFFQAKNYWQNENFAMGQNYYNSDDPSGTFVCPRLLASLMKLDTFSVSNTLTFQLRDSSGKAVNDFATFQTRVNVDGNQYTVTFNNGRATITDVDPNVDHDIEVEMENGFIKKVANKASGDEGNSEDSKSSSSVGDRGSSSDGNDGASEVRGNSNYQGSSTGGNSSGSHVANSDKSGNYGTNSSSIPSQDTSDNGNNALYNGDLNAGDSGSGDASQEGKAYEIVPPVTTSKELTNTSGLVVLSILSIMGMLIYGYWRKDEFEQ
ncbi:MAG: right-handed parallel beta-helix repeat-containing protein, partial [Methanobrevibacter sp.]|nr:right-handed parallel beta-helix repeat-containing protein [Methanobrevibacter sp.]